MYVKYRLDGLARLSPPRRQRCHQKGTTVKFGLFQTPFTRPERSPRQVFDWAVDQAIAADQAGLEEFWVGQHFTLGWEAIPNPELVLAAAARETEQIILAPGAHLLPYQHPAHLASQTSWMSHITEGRYILGVATGVNPVDAKFHGFKSQADNLEMSIESLELMRRIWAGGPIDFEGKYWSSQLPAADHGGHHLRDLRPYGGSMTIAMAGASPDSTSIAYAGNQGFIPLSFGGSPELVANHWETYLQGARDGGIDESTLSRDIHHVGREIFVAETDAEAERLVMEGPIGYAWREHLIPNELRRASRIGVEPLWTLQTDFRDVIRAHMVVGSPETVAEKLNVLMDASGGWGTTLIFGHDFIDDPAPWNHSLELLHTEVAPRVKSVS